MLKLLLIVALAVSISNACWLEVPGGLRQIDGGLTPAVWGTNRDDNIYLLNGDGRSWTRVGGKLIHVSAGGGGVWGVNKNHDIFYRHGTLLGGTGGSWQHVGGKLKQIDSGPSGIVMGVNRKDNIYCRTGINPAAGDYVGNGWKRIPGKLMYISCGQHLCWGVNSKHNIYVRMGVTAANCAGTNWVPIPGKLVQIETSFDNEVWGVNKNGQIYYRNGITNANLNGTGWTRVAESLRHVTNGYRGVYGVNRIHRIYNRK